MTQSLVVIDPVWREACSALLDEDRASMRGIAAQVAHKHGVGLKALRGAGQCRHLVRARNEAFLRCHLELGKSYAEIGRFFGHRDYSTVGSALRQMRKISTLFTSAPVASAYQIT